ncbi:DUF6053 domain-containing protein [Lysobacter enzymogenes]|uniref:DUF6053 domain-containing protein n=1 Tax=Lysobacter enzymogenes TaxID=69 RepID=UPI003D18967F
MRLRIPGRSKKPAERRAFFVGGTSVPMLSFRIAASRKKSVGTEVPPTGKKIVGTEIPPN